MADNSDQEGAAPSQPVICREKADLYAPRSRRIIAKLCRDFLDTARLTPTELLHSPAAQRQYLERGTEYQQAVQKAAMVQAQPAGQNVAQRVRELYNVVDAAVAEVMARTKAKPPAPVDPKTFVNFVAAARKAELAEVPDFTVYVALAAYLGDVGTWTEKVERLNVLIEGVEDLEVLPIFDSILAEVVGSPAALRDMIGEVTNLGRLLEGTVDLLAAPLPSSVTLEEGGQKVRALLAEYPLPETRAALLRELRRGLESKGPLVGSSGPADLNAHLQLLETLSRAGDTAGGENMLAVLGERLPKILSNDTLQTVLRPSGRADQRLIRALDIYRRLGNAPGRMQVRQYIQSVFEFERVPQQFKAEIGTLLEDLDRLTKLHQAFTMSGLVEQQLSKFTGPLEAAQEAMLPTLFELVERNGDTPAARALELLDRCADGAFITGKNLRAVHRQIRRYMQDENFAATFLAGAEDKQAQTKRLVELHRKLLRSGLAADTQTVGSA
jgi:hypothetical protein